MTDNLVERQHGIEDRSTYWRKEIDGKTVSEIADIIVGLEQRATRDRLTGLINKDEFLKEFNSFSEGALRRGSSVYVFFLDFDDLKKVNDAEGHKAGDELLKRGSEVLKSSLRSSDLLARIGGDEFAAALETGYTDAYQNKPEDIVQRIVSSSTNKGISISVGISKFEQGDDLNDVLDEAEKNMKFDKGDRKAGRDFQE